MLWGLVFFLILDEVLCLSDDFTCIFCRFKCAGCVILTVVDEDQVLLWILGIHI